MYFIIYPSLSNLPSLPKAYGWRTVGHGCSDTLSRRPGRRLHRFREFVNDVLDRQGLHCRSAFSLWIPLWIKRRIHLPQCLLTFDKQLHQYGLCEHEINLPFVVGSGPTCVPFSNCISYVHNMITGARKIEKKNIIAMFCCVFLFNSREWEGGGETSEDSSALKLLHKTSRRNGHGNY